MPTINLPNLISSLKDLLEVWRKTQNGGIAVREINHLMLRLIVFPVKKETQKLNWL